MGQQIATLYNVANTGDAALSVTDMNISGADAAQFTFFDWFGGFCGTGQDCARPFTVYPGASSDIGVACSPTRTGAITATLTVTSNATNSAGHDTVVLACTGLAHASVSTLAFSPTSLDYGVVYADAWGSIDKTLTVTNTADPDTEPLEFDVRGMVVGNGEIAFPDKPYGYLMPGFSMTYTVRFRWWGSVPSAGPLEFYMADPLQPTASIPIFAEAAYGLLVFDDPPGGVPFAMPAVPLGSTSTRTIKIHNGGDFQLLVDDAFAYIDGGTAELLGATRLVELAPGESLQWTLACTPTTSTTHGQIWVNEGLAAGNFDTLDFTCPVAAAALALDPADMAFGDVVVGEAKTLSVDVTNIGDAPTELTAVTSSDPAFAVTPRDTLPIAIAPGDHTTVDVTFAPTLMASWSATLTFTSSSGADVALPVSGTGFVRDITVAPLAIDFGSMYVDATVKLSDLLPGGIAIANHDPSRTFTITSVELTGDPSYSLIGPDHTALPPDGAAMLDVELTPQSTGTLTASIDVFVDGDPNAQAHVTMTVTALAHHGGGCGFSAPRHATPIGFAVLGVVLVRRRRSG